MRTYLVVIDETEESALALRFAGRRAASTGGAVHLLTVIEPGAFLAWGGAQATIDAEAMQKAEELVSAAAQTLKDEHGIDARISVRRGDPTEEVSALLAQDETVAALVLAAAAGSDPGPLVSHFAGTDAGLLRVPLMIIPGALTLAEVDALS